MDNYPIQSLNIISRTTELYRPLDLIEIYEYLWLILASVKSNLEQWQNKSSCLAQALGVTKFIIVTDIIWSHFVVLLKSHLDVQQTHLWCLHMGCTILIRREPKACLGRGFNSKLSSFAILHRKCMARIQELLELKTRPRFRLVSQSIFQAYKVLSI